MRTVATTLVATLTLSLLIATEASAQVPVVTYYTPAPAVTTYAPATTAYYAPTWPSAVVGRTTAYYPAAATAALAPRAYTYYPTTAAYAPAPIATPAAVAPVTTYYAPAAAYRPAVSFYSPYGGAEVRVPGQPILNALRAIVP